LLSNGAASRQRYEQAKTALDTAQAQLAAAQADARVAGNEANYAILVSDVDGTVVETLGEPGQVVSAGQTVVRIARPARAKRWVALPKRSGRRSARWPRPVCMGAMNAAIRHICGSYRIPPTSRPVPMSPLCARRRSRRCTAWRDGNHSACKSDKSAANPGAAGSCVR
jgi:multidrug efflux pump subunit AcrA (membrane-fusion protein)